MGRSGSNKRDQPFHSLMELLLVAAREPARLGDHHFHYSYCTAVASGQGDRAGDSVKAKCSFLSHQIFE